MDVKDKTPAAAKDVVAAARDLGPLLTAKREETERLRRLPAEIVESLADAGLLQMYLPRSMGGPELPPLTVFHAVETLSRADGAAGWCAMISSSISRSMGLLPADVGRELCGHPADLRASGSLRAQGRAYKVPGGYRVVGRWNFASGIDHANVLNCRCVIMDGETPRLNPNGTPKVGAMWIPAHEAAIEDTWSVIGLRGTGSNDFMVDNVFVPDARASFNGAPPCETGPLYHVRLHLTSVWAAAVATALGIARGAIDSFIELASRADSTGSTSLLRDRPFVQARLAEAEAIHNAARAYVIDSTGAAWAAICNDTPDPTYAIGQARLALVHGMHEAVRAVDLVFHAAGTNAIHRGNPLERYFRDVHVAVQHNAALHTHYESAGQVLMGLTPADQGW